MESLRRLPFLFCPFGRSISSCRNWDTSLAVRRLSQRAIGCLMFFQEQTIKLETKFRSTSTSPTSSADVILNRSRNREPTCYLTTKLESSLVSPTNVLSPGPQRSHSKNTAPDWLLRIKAID